MRTITQLKGEQAFRRYAKLREREAAEAEERGDPRAAQLRAMAERARRNLAPIRYTMRPAAAAS